MEVVDELSAFLESVSLDELRGIMDVALKDTWRRQSREAIGVARELLNERGLTRSELRNLTREIAPALGFEVGRQTRETVDEVVDLSYRLGQEQVGLGLTSTFNRTDVRAIRWLEQHHEFWIGNRYDDATQARIVRAGQEVLERGLGRAEAGRVFAGEFPELLSKDESYWELLSNNTVTRSSEFGRVEGYVKSGVQRIRIDAVIDRRTSDICEEMDGKVYEVDLLVEQRDALMDAEDPEDVKAVAPWPASAEELRDKSEAQLAAEGIVMPPYHGNCRTRTVIL